MTDVNIVANEEKQLILVTPKSLSKKRSIQVSETTHQKKEKKNEVEVKLFKRENELHTISQPKWPRDFVGVIDDAADSYKVHSVYGYTKHWFDKDYIKLKRDQILTNLKWWCDMNSTILDDCNGQYDPIAILDKFWEEILEQTNNIEFNIENYDAIVLNVLNQESLGALINRKKNDAVVHFLYNLIHFNKMTIYKAECCTVVFESVTVFENKDGVLCGEMILVAGKKMKWRSLNCPINN